MHQLFSLGARLQKCADFVRPGSRVADIGTDHGYLPIWLLKTGRVSCATAADIGEGPLSAAKNNALKYEADLCTVLSDGFEKIDFDSFDDAVMAGMGGELMAHIIAAADFLKDGKKRLILQPMTSAPELRRYLAASGFQIECEEAVKDDKKVYSVMRAVYNPEKAALRDAEIYMGKLVPQTDACREYAEAVLKRMKNSLLGVKHQGEEETAENLKRLMEKIEKEYL